MKKLLALVLTFCMVFTLCACGQQAAPAATATPAATEAPVEAAEVPAEEPTPDYLAETTVYVDAAASMKGVFEKIIELYKEEQPNVNISLNTGSSGKLLTGIEEAAGIDHDIFFSAGASQVKTLDEEDQLMVPGSRVDLLSNAVCLVKGKDTETAVTGWDNIKDAKNMALTDGATPVGKYTRQAFINLGLIDAGDKKAADITTDEVAAALGIEINECDDVSAVAQAVAEGSNEIGTVYYTDWYGYQDMLDIIAMDDGTLTGAITYPVCQVANSNADEAELAAVADFLEFLQSAPVLELYKEYCFIVNE